MPRFIENVAAPAAQTDSASASNATSEVLIIATIAAIRFAADKTGAEKPRKRKAPWPIMVKKTRWLPAFPVR
ncbi:hypothetical protein GCM10010837_06340 [Aminobacter niigataensis]